MGQPLITTGLVPIFAVANNSFFQDSYFGQPMSVKDNFDSPISSNLDSLEAFLKYRKMETSKVKKIRTCKLCSNSGHDKRNCPLKV